MLKSTCIHPGIIHALSLCGHGSKVLIADGNYPLFEKTADAEKIYLGLTHGLPTVTQVLAVVQDMVNIEKVELMAADDGTSAAVHRECEQMLGTVKVEKLSRQDFYDSCSGDHAPLLVISTGDTRQFANILLTIGCV